MAPHSSTLAWRIPRAEEPGRLQSMGSWRVGHDWATSLSLFTFMHWRRKWQPAPVFLPGESQGRGSLVGCRLWGRRVGHDWSDLAVGFSICKTIFYFFLSYLEAFYFFFLPDDCLGLPVLCRIGVGRVDTLALFLVLQEKLSVPHMMPAVGLSIPRRRVCRQPRARHISPLLCGVAILLCLMCWAIVSGKHVEFCQMLFLHLLRWLYNIYLSFY